MNEDLIRGILKKNHLQQDLDIEQFKGGVVNLVFNINDKYVVKLEKEYDVTVHQPDIFEKLEKAGAKIPRLIDCGELNGKNYLLMEKLPGKKLSESWLILSTSERDRLMHQIVDQLRIYHGIAFKNYSPRRPYEFENWKDAMVFYTKFDELKTKSFDKKTTENVNFIHQYFDAHIRSLSETGSAVLVHNDIHFENILHKDSELTGIIDFDFTRQAPRDYELWHMLDFFKFPEQYVEDKLENAWSVYSPNEDVRRLKSRYPELFTHPDILTRLRLYIVDEVISALQDGVVDKFNAKADTYFHSNYLESCIS